MDDRLATIDIGQKVEEGGGCCAPVGEGELGPDLTQCSVPSDILIHPAVWPQQTMAENWGCAPFVVPI